MLTTTKPALPAGENKLVSISFLLIDGTEVEEDPNLLDSKQYVSSNDSNKYGKVESYSKGGYKYYLKQYRGGRAGELLVNPYGMYAKAEDLSAFVTQRGHTFCEYIPVKEEIYHTYLAYLRTRDSRYFRHAEKEILDTVR